MTPHYSDPWLTVYAGDCRDVLPTLPETSVDCVVTSPPYWGLRDYGTATWAGGDEGCDHIASYGAGRPGRETPGGRGGTFPHNDIPHKTVCGKCGATRQDAQLGLEPTPEEYVANLVAVFREVRRVLKPSGTCWLNLGDSYSNPDKGGYAKSRVTATDSMQRSNLANNFIGAANRQPQTGLKPKDLVGIPWRVAFALQADGWYLRSDIIWSKPNPMPESVTDRPTKAHEYLFLLTKSARYYYDADAVREPLKLGADHDRPVSLREDHRGFTSKGEDVDHVMRSNPAGRNLRSVWTIATRPYADAHFAVFPPELPERCIKAGSSERGVCPECGASWERTTDKSRTFESGSGRAGNLPVGKNGTGLQGGGETVDIRRGPVVHVETTGWADPCGNDLTPDPAVILDPFAGSGTVGLVANRLSRRAILIDLNPAYLRQQMQRNAQTPLGLAGR